MGLKKDDSKMLQGLCALAMVCLHLFNKNYEGLFQPLVFIKGIPLSFYISLLCDFCVMGYAFCSGYAHMVLYEKPEYYKRRIKSLAVLLCHFWFVLIVFSMVSIIFGKADFMPGSIQKFIKNALLLENSYNGAWWYLFTYVMIVLFSPVILRVTKKSPGGGIGPFVNNLYSSILCTFLRTHRKLAADKIWSFRNDFV